jgi:hypothetical protein
MGNDELVLAVDSVTLTHSLGAAALEDVPRD